MNIEVIQYTAPESILAERIVLVTGAGGGIGSAVSQALAAHGATVILSGRNKKKLETVYDAIESSGGPTPTILEADLEKLTWDDYLSMASMLAEQFGRLDGLLHNAAILGDRSPIEYYDTMTWHRVMHVNLSAQFLMTRALLPVIKQAADPTIVFSSSSVGRTGLAFWGAYAVSKFGTEGLMQVLANESEDIRVNCINPGATLTSMRKAAYPGGDPMNPAKPEEIVGAYLYLLGPDSKGVTGQTFDAQERKAKPADS